MDNVLLFTTDSIKAKEMHECKSGEENAESKIERAREEKYCAERIHILIASPPPLSLFFLFSCSPGMTSNVSWFTPSIMGINTCVWSWAMRCMRGSSHPLCTSIWLSRIVNVCALAALAPVRRARLCETHCKRKTMFWRRKRKWDGRKRAKHIQNSTQEFTCTTRGTSSMA